MVQLLTWWIFCVVSDVVFSQALDSSDSYPVIYGETKEDVFQYYDQQIVFPTELLLFPETHPTSQINSRSKRDTDKSVSSKEFILNGFDERFHMQVKLEQDLLAPGFKVYHLKDGISRKMEENVENCLFNGKLRYQPRSVVALNLCGGMTGLIRSETADYLIEPVTTNSSNVMATSKPHILKRRSIERPPKKSKYQPNQQTHFCGKKKRYMPRKPRRKDYWLPGEFSKMSDANNRTKRSISEWKSGGLNKDRSQRQHQSRRRSVETLVVADREVVRKHGTENVTTYLLTVFNMVSMLYQDSSIDNDIRVILVGLVLLEGDEPGLSLSHNAEGSLYSFCQWQSTVHTSSGRQHDHAVLVTGLDICSWKDEPCDTLGYAPINGMCSKYRSCTVNEDSGLALSFTVAHEIGHNFGMLHDGQGSSPCRKGRGTLMSASLSGLDTSVLWSECSRRDLADFLQSSKSQCLKNEPKSPGDHLQFPNHLPGQLYDADMQCKLQFGKRSKLCTNLPRKNEVCRSLWCQRNGRECETKFLPAAEGTPCGKSKWCRKGSCVDIDLETLKKVDGGWSEFTAWSNCSRACNGGLMVRQRFCDSPPPQNGGSYCKGEDKEYQICGTKQCASGNIDFQLDQCSTFNKRTVKGKLYKWKPYSKDLGALSRCRIYCVPDKEDLNLVLSTKLQDGTSCSGNFSGVCIDGECRSMGCDGKVDSDLNPDYCGVCNGDNSTCRTVKGTFRVHNFAPGYHEVIKIPSGSRHLRISETRETSSYLALKELSGRRRLNGRRSVDWPGRYEAAGTIFSYRRWPGKPENLVAKGPTTEELVVEVLVREKEEFLINYKFVVAYKPKWRYQNSTCSVSCGSGTYAASPVCLDSMNKILSDGHCDKTLKPFPMVLPCHEIPCPARWEIGKWSDCIKGTCEHTWKHRLVFCTQGNKEVSESLCPEMSRPIGVQECMKEMCNYKWHAGPWSKCHGGCSTGFQTRSVTCRRFSNGTSESFLNCDKDSQPPHIRKCKTDNCSKREDAVWHTSPWSECNVFCGQGEQTRNISCLKKYTQTQVASSICDSSLKPSTQKTCTAKQCNESKTLLDCVNHYEWCPTSTNGRLCKLKFYATNCCRTCRAVFL